MKRQDAIYYGVLFAAGAVMAWWFRKEYLNLKAQALVPKPVKYVSFGVRG